MQPHTQLVIVFFLENKEEKIFQDWDSPKLHLEAENPCWALAQNSKTKFFTLCLSF